MAEPGLTDAETGVDLDVGKVTGALVGAGETVREVGVIEHAPTAEADCVVDNADGLWRS